MHVKQSDVPSGLQVEAEVLESCIRRGRHDAEELRRGTLLKGSHCHVPAAVSLVVNTIPWTLSLTLLQAISGVQH